MTREEICTYEVAKLAKEKGFPQDPDKNDHCLMYCWDGLRNIHPLAMWIVWEMEEYDHDNLYAAPNQSLLQRWLREEKGIHISVFPNMASSFEFDYIVYNKGDKFWNPIYTAHSDFDTYELALEDALDYSLKNLV
ncbi:MAG: hypothetical protein II304_00210 [Bacteroidales bacterium]|nr:hypothetical protein [Bacteroidales bacterium]